MTLTKRDYDYYVRIKAIDPEKAEEYKNQFRPKVEWKEEKKDEMPVMTDAEIEQKNIETMQEALAQKVEEKRPEIMYSAKEVKKMLLERWVKNAKFLTDEKAMAKAKEIGL